MSSSQFARILLVGGVALAVLGLILWRTLPISANFPPFLVTALLAIAYGGYEVWSERSGRRRPGR